jgi:Spy/CpxP family protein refolding chaperone
MKKPTNLTTASLFILLALIAMPAFAQPGRGQGQRPGQGQGQGRQFTEEGMKRRVAALADSLDMTADQEKKITAYELELFKEMQKARQNFDPETGDREAMREKMMEIRDKRNAKYEEVLSAEQYAKYNNMVQSRMRQRPPGGGEGEGERPSRGRGRGGS